MDTPVQVSIIELREEGVDCGICWRLLSTLKVTTLAQTLRLARWYAKRWQIEEFHRILKTGCRVDARQMRGLERLKQMMALDMIVACSLMGMSAAARQQPESPASDWLDAEEVNALEAYDSKGAPPVVGAKPLSIGVAVKSIARLGGHLGRKGDGHPGAQSSGKACTSSTRSPRLGGDSVLEIVVGKAQALVTALQTLRDVRSIIREHCFATFETEPILRANIAEPTMNSPATS